MLALCGHSYSLDTYIRVGYEWCMARLAGKNGHQKDLCFEEMGECAQHTDSFLCSIENIAILILKEKRETSLWTLKTFCISSLILRLRMILVQLLS